MHLCNQGGFMKKEKLNKVCKSKQGLSDLVFQIINISYFYLLRQTRKTSWFKVKVYTYKTVISASCILKIQNQMTVSTGSKLSTDGCINRTLNT